MFYRSADLNDFLNYLTPRQKERLQSVIISLEPFLDQYDDYDRRSLIDLCGNVQVHEIVIDFSIAHIIRDRPGFKTNQPRFHFEMHDRHFMITEMVRRSNLLTDMLNNVQKPPLRPDQKILTAKNWQRTYKSELCRELGQKCKKVINVEYFTTTPLRFEMCGIAGDLDNAYVMTLRPRENARGYQYLDSEHLFISKSEDSPIHDDDRYWDLEIRTYEVRRWDVLALG